MTPDNDQHVDAVDATAAALIASAHGDDLREPPSISLANLGTAIAVAGETPARRQFVLWPHVARGVVSATFAPGGFGKSTLLLAEAVAVASGYGLLERPPEECGRVLYVNGEDGPEDLGPRLQAVMTHFDLTEADLGGRLHVHSMRDCRLAWSGAGEGVEFDEVKLQSITKMARALNIALVVFDPLRAFHSLNEDRNALMRQLIARFGRLAAEANCAVDLSHHARKLNGRESIGIDDMAGASDIANAVRSARGFRRMADHEASLWGVSPDEQGRFVRVETLKTNIGPTGHGYWFRLVPVRLADGSESHTAEPWTPPNLYEEVTASETIRVQRAIEQGRGPAGEPWRASIQVKDAWVGHAVAEALGLDVKSEHGLLRVKFLLRRWFEKGTLVVSQLPVGVKGKRVPVVEVGVRA